jgi:protein involved in polysaccharide export with SLBB domain
MKRKFLTLVLLTIFMGCQGLSAFGYEYNYNRNINANYNSNMNSNLYSNINTNNNMNTNQNQSMINNNQTQSGVGQNSLQTGNRRFWNFSKSGNFDNSNYYDENAIYLQDKEQNAFSNNYQNLSTNIKYANLSQIEKLFNGDEVDYTKEPLMQIGYDFFSAPISNNVSTAGKYDDTYKFSIGEKISAYLYGDSVDVVAISGSQLLSPVVQTEVDSKGNIFIQGIGVVQAENKTIREVESAINKIASSKYNNLKIKLNVATGQDFSVFVYGHVNKPGKVVINNNSSILDALSAAGGVKKSGTLRKISYTNGKKTREVDLYKTLFTGSGDDIILRPNDKIFVGGIGNVVALKNGVEVPGIYEAKDGETLQKLISYAGGLLPGTQQNEVVLTSLDMKTLERSAKNISWTEANHTKLKTGDVVEFKEIYNSAENTVTIQGNIKHPATYAYKQGMRLSDILKDEKELLEETFITQAVIRRVSGKDNTIETIPVFLKEFFAGLNDPLLQPRDVINIYKNTNTEFVDIFGCISTPKHLTYVDDMRLDDVLTDIQFIESNIEEDKNEKDVSYKRGENNVLMGGTTNSSRVISAENVAVEITGKDDSTQVYYLYDIMINGNTMKNIILMPGDKVFFRTLRDNETIKNVKVSGFVKHPGVFRFVEGKRLIDMITMADGLTEDSDLRGIVFIRKNIQTKQVDLAQKNNDRDISLLEGRLASGYKQTDTAMEAKSNMITMLKQEQRDYKTKYTGQIALNIKNNDITKIKDIDNIEVQDGDEIYVPRMSNHVCVLGEVYNEQSFVYRNGMKVKGYIREVGGYTPNAARFRLYKVGVNGRAVKVHGWTKVAQGDTIVVPRKIAGNDWLTPVCDTLKGIASIMSTALVVTKW